MTVRTLPGIGLKGFFGLGFDGWDVDHDFNLRLLSVLVYATVKSRVAAEPGSPVDGDIYLMTGTANVNKIAVRDNGVWVYINPWEGYTIWVADEDIQYRYSGTAWAPAGSLTYSDEQGRDAVGLALQGGSHVGVTVVPNDAGDTIAILLDDEYIQDLVGAMVSGNTEIGIGFVYNDTTGKYDITTVGFQPYVVGTFFDAPPVASEVLLDHTFPVAVSFGANWSGSYASVITPPATTYVIDIQKATGGGGFSNVGTISIAITTGVATFATSGNFAAGDRIRLKAPATIDGSIAGFSASLLGVR